MKAIRVHQFGGPEVLRFEDTADPKPGPGQALIRVYTVGVNPVETYQRTGSNPAIELPWTPGTDAVGVIEAFGPDPATDRVKVGERVYTSDTLTGAYAEWAVCDIGYLHPLPAKLSFAQGAAINIPYATAYRALHQRAKASPGEVLLIHGASGGVGVAATQIARAAGLTIIGTAGTEAGRKLVAAQGAHHVLDHRSPGYLEQVLKLTGGRGVDILLEMLANVNLGKDLTVLANSGRVIVVGSRGNVELTPRELMRREADIRGLMLFNASERELAGIHAALAAGLENSTLRPVVGRELSLADAAKAHVAVLEPGAHGKIVLRVRTG
ncbi:MAG TPA: NADPH:quinone reductase [Verrucomicrobiae bacterium]|nr:NADPH:quinone reductase [Verrucomicrobiae bacterium]